MKISLALISLSLFAFQVSAAPSASAPPKAPAPPKVPPAKPACEFTQGDIPFKVPAAGKPCKTHYKLYGNLRSGVRPLIVLHGGPGIDSAYTEPIADLATQHGIPVILYDQIGNGQSTHLPEKFNDTTFWTEQLFMNELNNVISFFKITDFDLWGHSWGGMLASRFATTHPKGLHKLILASTPASVDLWVVAANQLRAQLPKDMQAILLKHEADGTTDDPEYTAVGDYYSSLHLCRISPFPAQVQEAFDEINNDPTVYLTMEGPSEFYITGSLINWTIIPEMRKINVPTLLTNGKYDEAQDVVMQPFASANGIPNVKWVKFQNSSHMAFWEERPKYIQELYNFIVAK